MTKTPVRAAATGLPNSRRAKAQSRKMTNVIDREEVKPADTAAEHFERLYCQWLQARALYFEPGQDDDEVGARSDACDEASRQLLIAAASSEEMLWRKWEVLEFYVGQDAIDGKATDNRAVMALGCIKADLIRLGIGDGRA